MNAPQEPADFMADFDVGHLRVPPHSIEAEQSVLGGLLLDNAGWDRASDLLTEADFYRHEHRAIFVAIGALVSANKLADVVTVFERLQAHGKAEECGGLKYLNDLAQSVPSASGIRRYAEIVRERAVCRQMIVAADEAAALGFDMKVPLAEKLERVGVAFTALQRGQSRKAPRRIGQLLAAAVDRYNDLKAGNVPPGIPSGIPPLDRILHGLKRGKLIGVAARPSVGKSTVARAIAVHAACKGYTVLACSMEMPADEVADCIISQVAQIKSDRLQTGHLDSEDWGRLSVAIDDLQGAPLEIDDEGGLTLAALRSKARAVKHLDLLVVDYLQLMGSTLKNATTNDQVAEISKGLKQLALELGIPIIVLSQLSRAVESRNDKEPQLSDLRDSGAIEQDLDIAVLLWTVSENEDTASRLVGWKVAKHRGGKKGSFGMRLQADIYWWEETSESIRPSRSSSALRGFTE